MRVLSLALLGLTLLAGCSNGRDLYDRSGRDVYNRSGRTARSYPASARTSQGGQERYRVCHNGRNALTIPASAVDAHLRHGDRFGSCSDHREDRRADRRDDRREGRRADRRDDRRENQGRGRGNGRGRH